MSRELHDVRQFSQAFAELIGISGSNHVDETQAATQLSRLANQFPQGTRLGMRCLVPTVVDDRGGSHS